MKTYYSNYLAPWLCLVCSVLSAAPCGAAVPGDVHWDPKFNSAGTTNSINGIAVGGGNLYTGGMEAGMVITNVSLNVWDGSQWYTAGSFSGGGGQAVIFDMAFVGNTLYVGGLFASVNGVPASGLARWDGTSWSSVGGAAGLVKSLAVDGNNNLYAAGSFTNAAAGGVLATNVGYWDGSQWNALGSGVGQVGSFGEALLVTNGLVYVGGLFSNCGSLSVSNIAVWNGTSWADVGGGINNVVDTFCDTGGTIYAGGAFTQAGSTAAGLIAQWNGSAWSAVGAGFTGSELAYIVPFGGQLYATGNFTANGGVGATNIAAWNGSAWSPVGAGLTGPGSRLFNNGTNLYVGGNYLAAGGELAEGIASFDGTNWSTIGTAGRTEGIASTARSIASDGTNLYAGGYAFNYAGQTNVNMIGRFDGTNWYALGSGITGPSAITGPTATTIFALTVTNGLVYAGGYFTTAGGLPVNNVAYWDGTNWYAMGNPGGIVASMLVSPLGIYACGAPFYNTSLYGSQFFSQWNGASWQSVSINFPPMTDTSYYFAGTVFPMAALAEIGTNIFIGGHFYIGEGGVECANIMRFDGTTGWVMGTGLNSNVTAMAVSGTNLYVTGPFTAAGSVAASKIAEWNGNYWTNVGSGLVGNGVINGVATLGADLYACGSFTNMGGVPVNGIAEWDGTNWYALGSGISFPGNGGYAVSSLGVSGPDLYVGGTFRQAGDKPSFNFAHWNGQVNFDTPQLSNPGQSNGQFVARVSSLYGLTNIIEATTNFTAWTPVLTNSSGIFEFMDPNTDASPYRFYRALLSQ